MKWVNVIANRCETTLGDHPYDSFRDRFITWLMRRRHMRTRLEEEPFLAVAGEVDRTLHSKARVFALHEGGEARAYTHGFLRDKGAFNDSVDSRSLAILYDAESDVAMAYRSELNGQRLSFRPCAGGGFEDKETGTRWDVLGQVTSGPYERRTLDPVPFSSTKSFGSPGNTAAQRPRCFVFPVSVQDRRCHALDRSCEVGAGRKSSGLLQYPRRSSIRGGLYGIPLPALQP